MASHHHLRLEPFNPFTCDEMGDWRRCDAGRWLTGEWAGGPGPAHGPSPTPAKLYSYSHGVGGWCCCWVLGAGARRPSFGPPTTRTGTLNKWTDGRDPSAPAPSAIQPLGSATMRENATRACVAVGRSLEAPLRREPSPEGRVCSAFLVLSLAWARTRSPTHRASHACHSHA